MKCWDSTQAAGPPALETGGKHRHFSLAPHLPSSEVEPLSGAGIQAEGVELGPEKTPMGTELSRA